MKNWSGLADNESIAKTIESLKANGIDAMVVENGEEARKKFLNLFLKAQE